jgi:hypothetical protein
MIHHGLFFVVGGNTRIYKNTIHNDCNHLVGGGGANANTHTGVEVGMAVIRRGPRLVSSRIVTKTGPQSSRISMFMLDTAPFGQVE